jgi:hypothetical protein
MERLKGLDDYFKSKSRAKLNVKQQQNTLGIPTMSEEEVRQSCVENQGYETPELNDKLYLHMRGFAKIENLEKYTGCKAIWLESNALDKIEGLDTLVECRCLYLAKNMINKIENLSCLLELRTLDLCNNRIRKIEGLSCLPHLDTLNISKNFLETAESIEHLTECRTLNTLDLCNNKLPAEDNVIEALKSITGLVTLNLNGNEITKLPQYRKKMIHAIPRMGYLDRPVDEVERIAAAAFFEGGAEAEKAAREGYREAQAQKRKDEMEQFKAWQADEREKRKNMPIEKKHELATRDEERRREREIEARKDAALEAKALEMGVSKLALHMMQGDGSINDFYEAQKAAVEANAAEKEAPRVEELPDAPPAAAGTDLNALDVLDTNSNNTTTTTAMPPAPPAGEEEEEEEEEAAVAETEEEKAIREQAEKEAAALKVKEDAEVAAVAAEKRKEEEEEAERAERVAESTFIWKQMQAAAKEEREREAALKRDKAAKSKVVELPEGADENFQPPEGNAQPLFWSEVEDIELARQVTATMFDFDAASEGLVKKFSKDVFTADACRSRWAELDAEQWSQPAEATNVASFKNYVSDSVLSAGAGKHGHGAQPSFENLSSMASGQLPGYLKLPTAFPSTNDILDEDLEELE